MYLKNSEMKTELEAFWTESGTWHWIKLLDTKIADTTLSKYPVCRYSLAD